MREPSTGVRLIAATDDDFVWLGQEPCERNGLRIADGGIDDAATLRMLAGINRSLRETGDDGAWMIVTGCEVVGLISFMGTPDAGGAVEFGYGIAPSRRRLGYATAAIARLVDVTRSKPNVAALFAETAVANESSARALARNGFIRCGERVHPYDGDVFQWKRSL